MKITKERLSEIIREEVNNFKLEEGGLGGHAEGPVTLTLPNAVREIENEADRVARFLGHGPGSEAVRGEEQFLVKALENLYKIAAQLRYHPAYEDSPMTEEDTPSKEEPAEEYSWGISGKKFRKLRADATRRRAAQDRHMPGSKKK